MRDSSTTFVLYLFGNIEWPQPQSASFPRVSVRFNSGGETEIPGSQTSEILDSVRSSNVNVEGVWILRADSFREYETF